MRFAVAITVLALSGIALILGIGQRTFLAPDAAVTYTLGDSADLNYAVIPAEVLTSVKGELSVTVNGKGAFVASGSERDVSAWVAIFDHGEISSDLASKSLTMTSVDAKKPVTSTSEEKPTTEPPATADTPTVADGADQTVPTPQGSDLWIQEAAASESASSNSAQAQLTSIAAQSDRSVLVATQAPSGLQNAITLTWNQDQRTPWAGPLLVAGGLLAIAGAILYLLAVDHSHRGLGPQRGRRGPLQGIRGSISRRRHSGRRHSGSSQTERPQSSNVKRIAAPAALLVGMFALSGCSANYWPNFSEPSSQPMVTVKPSSEIAPVPITQTQIHRILTEVASVADRADESLDSTLLDSRFTGDALAQRTASYTIRAAVPDYSLIPPHITDTELGYNLVQSTQGWPRTVLVALASDTHGADAANTDATTPSETTETTDPAADSATTSPSLALILTQESPHTNYLVSRIVALRGGITMPEASPADEGTALLADDLQTLILPPGEVAPTFAAVLQNGMDAPGAADFALEADDSLMSRSGFAWVKQSQERAAADGYSIQYSVAVSAGSQPITALSVSDGGALVAVTIKEDRVSDTAGSTTRVRAEGAVSALSGLSGQQTRLVNTVAHQLLFFVPSKVSGGQIELLGATSEMVGAGN